MPLDIASLIGGNTGLLSSPEAAQGPECGSPECSPRLAPSDDAIVGLSGEANQEQVSDLSDSGGEDDVLRKVRGSTSCFMYYRTPNKKHGNKNLG